jgi:hypothetical protein
MPGNLLTFLLTFFALFSGTEPNSGTTGDNGSGLDPNG